MRAYIIFSILFIFCLCLSSCDQSMVFEEYKEIPDNVWRTDDAIQFEAAINDTTPFYNLYINIRNTGDYTYSNLFVFVDILSPEGIVESDTIECILADPTGRWLGEGFANVYDNRIMFRRNVRFPEAGIYRFTFVQAMRRDELQGISDVGLRVEISNG